MKHLFETAGVSHSVTMTGLQSQLNTHMSHANTPSWPQGTAKITFTSGTTGTPKGVCLHADLLEKVALSLVQVIGPDFIGAHACTLPLAILLENSAGVYAGLIAGCTIQLCSLSTFGHAYVSLNTPHNDKLGTTGQLLPHVKLANLADSATHNTTHDGDIQIVNQGFLGYIGESAPEIVSTGDLGHIDHDGFVKVTGREKNVLITSHGRNISPEWVESILLAQPDIAQAVVFGDGQASLSAFIVPTKANANIHQAIEQANRVLPEYAHIKSHHCVPPFTLEDGTLTGTGRPRRNAGADSIMQSLHLPQNAFSYLFSHGSLDIEHMKFFEQTVNKIEDPLDQSAIIEVAQNAFELFAQVLNAIPHKGAVRHAA